MSARVYDGKGRWRNKTVAFRVSSEEDLEIETYVQISGLTKQDYLIQRVLQKEITVLPNPRIFKALRNNLERLSDEVSRLEMVGIEQEELLELVRYVAEVLVDLKGGCECQ